MATAKSKSSTTTARKASKPAAAKKPTAAKTKPTKPAVKIGATTTIPKSASAKAQATRAIPGDREQKLAEQALTFVDEAAAILRDRIRDGATLTAKGRIAAKKRASSLLDRASRDLGKALDVSTTSLHSILKKL